MKYKYEFESFRKGERLLCATAKVTYRTDDHPSKKAITVDVDLVVVKEFKKNGKPAGEFYLLCDFDDSSSYSLCGDNGGIKEEERIAMPFYLKYRPYGSQTSV